MGLDFDEGFYGIVGQFVVIWVFKGLWYIGLVFRDFAI